MGYTALGKQEQAIDLLEKYIAMVPNLAEYSLLKSVLFGQKGNCYKEKEEYKTAIEDIQKAIFYAEKVLPQNSQRLAMEYQRIGTCYAEIEDWKKAIEYYELANIGYEQLMVIEKGTLYFNEGYTYWELKEYDKAKLYFLKSYINKKIVAEELKGNAGKEYCTNVKERLHMAYLLENNFLLSFDEWLDQELAQVEEEVIEE